VNSERFKADLKRLSTLFANPTFIMAPDEKKENTSLPISVARESPMRKENLEQAYGQPTASYLRESPLQKVASARESSENQTELYGSDPDTDEIRLLKYNSNMWEPVVEAQSVLFYERAKCFARLTIDLGGSNISEISNKLSVFLVNNRELHPFCLKTNNKLFIMSAEEEEHKERIKQVMEALEHAGLPLLGRPISCWKSEDMIDNAKPRNIPEVGLETRKVGSAEVEALGLSYFAVQGAFRITANDNYTAAPISDID
jgi:hypothetical protein